MRVAVRLPRTMRSTGSLRALAAVAVAAALARPSAARAGTVAVLAVAPEPGPGPALVEVTRELRARVAELRAGTLDAPQTRERMDARAATPTLAQAQGAVEAARLAYLAGHYDRSLAILRSVADDLERLPEGPEVFTLWAKVLTRLARTELDLGRADAARAWIDRLVRAAPELTFDPALHTARLVEEVERVRDGLRDAPAATLVVRSSVPGVRVRVSGRELGLAPARLVLPRGRYRVSGALGELRAGPVPADLREGNAEVLLDLTVPAALRPELGPGLALAAGDRARTVADAGSLLGLDQVITVSVAGEGDGAYLVGALYDVRRAVLEREGRVRMRGDAPPGATAAIAEFLVTGRAAEGVVEVSGEPRAGVAVVPGRTELGPPPSPPQPGPETPPDPPGRFSVGLRLGYATGLGDVGGTRNMASWIGAQVPIQLEALVRVTRRLSLGVYGSYGFGRPGNEASRICDLPGMQCMLSVLRAGVQAHYAMQGRSVFPWVAAGAGYEWNALHFEDGSLAGGGDIMYRGLELLNVQVGFDWRPAASLAVGPFLMVSSGRYDRESSRIGGVSSGGAMPHPEIHSWAQVGLRGRFDL